MMGKDFVAWVQGYYGPYPAGQQRDIADYVRKLSQTYLDALKQTLLEKYTSKYGKPPDVATLEEYYDDAMEKKQPLLALESPPEEEYRETRDLAAEARDRGIDPTKQGWMARLVLEITKDKKKQEVLA